MLLQEMTWPEIGNLSRDIPVLVPVAALEQHGHHMPVFTDSLLLGEVVRRVGAAMTDRVLFAPLMWLGNSHHHLDFPGTLSASPRVYLDLLNDLAENLLAHGFRRIVFVNGHGGNITPGKQAIFELRQRHRDRERSAAAVRHLLGSRRPERRRVPDLVQYADGPRLRVGDVDDAAAGPASGEGLQAAGTGRVRHSASSRPTAAGPRRTAPRPGTSAIRRHATAEKGEYLFATYTAGVVALLEDVIAWDGKSWEMP